MQPIRLTLENFGPYEQTTIDFSDYYAQSLFLISGKTGAGKTTIFDGMSYALYGRTSGGLREGKEMRSNFAEADDKTKVTFVFKQDHQTYELEREPEQLVRKLRGEGFRNQPAEVKLTIYDENQVEINQLTKQKDVGPFLDELIKLNEQQFSQIVMLPQGEFRRFLNATSDSKEKVLRKLFNTYFYQDIAKRLREQKKQQETDLKELQSELGVLVSHLKWQESFTEEDLDKMYYQDLLKLYQEQAKKYQLEEQELTKTVSHLQEEEQKEQEKLQAEKKWQELFTSQKKVQQDLADLKEQEPHIKEVKESIKQLEKIKDIQPTVAYLDGLKEDQEKITKTKAELEEKLAKTNTGLTEAGSQKKALIEQKEDIEACEKQLAEIETSIPQFVKKNELEKNKKNQEEIVKKATDERDKTLSRKEKLKIDLEEIEKVIVSKMETIEEKYEITSQLEMLEKQLLEVKAFDLKMTELTEEELALKVCQTELVNVSQQLANETMRYKQLNSDWAKAQIARLSLELVEGEACPVCGSESHPNVTHEKTLTKADLEALEKNRDQADETVAEIKEEQTTLTNTISFKEATIKKLATVVSEQEALIKTYFEEELDPLEWLEALTKQKAEMTTQKEEVEAKLIQIEKETKRSEQLKQELTQLTTDLETQEKELRELQDRQLEAETALKELIKNLPSTWSTLEEMLKEQEKLLKKTTQWHEELAKQEAVLKQLEEEKIVLSTSLTNEMSKQEELLGKIHIEETKVADFLAQEQLDQGALTTGLKKISSLPTLTKEVTEFDKQEYALTEEAKKLATQLADKTEPDIQPLEEKVQGLTAEVKNKQNSLTKLQILMENNQKIVTTAQEKERAMKESLDSLEEITELANVMTGDAANKLSVERFVLQTYLKRILNRGNEKLVELTNGRYRFELKEERGSYKKETGLEINIYDDNVGVIRSVNTLSGGESFIAALSLALSLAEVIQEEAGGVKIDAMFIDEGFGSLDEDALEMAIRALESIEGEGRLIGIISHVRELKERIPQQLQVKSTVDGKSYVEKRLEFE